MAGEVKLTLTDVDIIDDALEIYSYLDGIPEDSPLYISIMEASEKINALREDLLFEEDTNGEQ